MPEVMTQLKEEHRHIADLLRALERQLARFDAAEKPDYDIVAAIADYFVGFPDCCHHPKEDLIYRALCARDPSVAETMTDLLAEHARIGAEARRFKEAVENVLNEVEVSRDAFHEAAERFIGDQREHLLMEEQNFFPKALDTLTEADWADIDRQVVDETDPVFGSDAADEYAALRDDILKWQAENDASKA
jgi:hemerythrin-like domain-containing protein